MSIKEKAKYPPLPIAENGAILFTQPVYNKDFFENTK